MAKSTMVTEFLRLGSPGGWKLHFLYFMIFTLTYLGTFLGNLLIVTVTTVDQNLHTPMYFFPRNLSILVMCFISITVPNACVNSLTGNRAISVAGCATQIFLVIFCVCVELLFLSIMAWDHYVAICQPLQYPIIMNPQFCGHMTLASLLSGLVYAGVHTGNTFRLSFCQANMVHQFFCDVPSLLRLSCSDTSSNMVLLLLSAVVVCGGCFSFIAMSHIHIFCTYCRIFPLGKSTWASPAVMAVSIGEQASRLNFRLFF